MSLKILFFRLISVSALSILISTTKADTVYDGATDFSISQNPNGVWRYGKETSLGGAFIPLPSFSIASGKMQGWGDVNTFAHVLQNVTGIPVQDGGTIYPAVGLEMHPGANGDYSVLRWIAPLAGIYSVAVMFADVATEVVASVDVHVLLNGNSLFSDELGAKTATSYMSGLTSLSAGDTVDFLVGVGSNQSYNFDMTTVDARVVQVSSVPDGGTTFLMMLLPVLALVSRSARSMCEPIRRKVA